MSIPGYELERMVSRDTLSIRYRARELATGRTVCVEVFETRPGFFRAPPVERYAHVLDVARLLVHPNIWPVERMSESERGHYYVRPWCGELLLSEHLRQERPAPSAAADWTRQLALAVQCAHDHGVYHRDLKPGNVLLWTEACGTVRPLLFGFELAYVAYLSPALQEMAEGTIVGTPAYMSPEQVTGKSSTYASSADVWGLGVMLFQMLTGQTPFAGRTAMEMLMAIMHREAGPIRSHDPSLDDDLDRITRKCLQKKVEQRYATAAELAGDLERWLQGVRTPEARPTFTQRLRGWLDRR